MDSLEKYIALLEFARDNLATNDDDNQAHHNDDSVASEGGLWCQPGQQVRQQADLTIALALLYRGVDRDQYIYPSMGSRTFASAIEETLIDPFAND